MKQLLFLLLSAFFLCAQTKDPNFFQKPYLQLGDRPANSKSEGLDLMWLGHDRDTHFAVEYKPGSSWRKAEVQQLRRVAVTGTVAHRVYRASLDKLSPGKMVPYRVLVGGKAIFESTAQARKPEKSDTHLVVFGDCAANTPGQRAVAYEVSKLKPDYVFVAGDIVYSRGRVSEYEEKFWPVYNADTAGPATGAPLLRSTLFTGVIGNHDSPLVPDFDLYPDSLAFFRYWSLPMNGPSIQAGGKHTAKFKGNEAAQRAFLSTTDRYPRMSNYSFDYGNVHWTVIDSNPYVDFTDPAFREWIRNDLKAASKAKWRFVGFHHPPFNSSKAHFTDQRVRLLADLFEEGRADLVIGGHVHNYQRTHPMKFVVEAGFKLGSKTEVPGKWTLDKSYDGDKNTKPNAPIYLVTGAGGATLYNPEQNGNPSTFQDFTAKFSSDTHSFTVIDASAKELKVRQISSSGKEIDRFTVTR
ncbi:metallophosphoesterase [Bryobacter aggregatus]|uniref:metallophosphoesterase n=1 Tax=Bryobacter aggregatus TaxID=360054 RepID=UPI0004E1E6C6|nr:metallophosphoesterase [Bryobacter aggregatus]